MELKINKKLEDIIPKLKEPEFVALKNSIKEKGLLKPIDVMSNGTVVDGHHRFRACKELKMQPLFTIMPNIKTIEEALKYSYTINYARRQLNPFERAEWTLKVFKDSTLYSREYNGHVCENLAKQTNQSETTLERTKKIMEAAPEKIQERLRNAELGIKDVYEFMTTLDKFPDDKKADFENEFKEGKVDTILIKKVYEHSLEAEETLNDYNELVQSQVKPNFEKELYTPQFDDKRLKQLQYDLLVASGGNPKLVTKYIETSEFGNDDTRAQAYAKKMGGRYIGKVTKVFYEIEIDPLKEE